MGWPQQISDNEWLHQDGSIDSSNKRRLGDNEIIDEYSPEESEESPDEVLPLPDSPDQPDEVLGYLPGAKPDEPDEIIDYLPGDKDPWYSNPANQVLLFAAVVSGFILYS